MKNGRQNMKTLRSAGNPPVRLPPVALSAGIAGMRAPSADT